MYSDSRWRQFIQFAIPSVLSAWIYCVYTIVDGIFIGRFIGDQALAGFNLITPFLYLPYSYSATVGIGGATLVARLLGEGRVEEARAAFTQALWLGLAGGVLCTFMLYFGAETLIGWTGAQGQLHDYSMQYLQSYAFFSVAVVAYALEYFLRIEGAARFGLLCYLIGAIINGLLDALLIVYFEMGISGAALATGYAQLFSNGLMLVYLFVKSKRIPPLWRTFADHGLYFGKMIYNGSSEMLAKLAPMITIFAFNWVILRQLGKDGVVAYTLLEYIKVTADVTMASLVQSMQPMISYYRGNGQIHALMESYRIGLISTLAFSLIATAGTLWLAEPLTHLFLPQAQEAWEILDKALIWYALAFIPAGINLAISGFLTAIEAPGSSTIIAILRSWLLLLGFLWLFSIWIGKDGIWFALLATEIATLFVSPFLYIMYRVRALN